MKKHNQCIWKSLFGLRLIFLLFILSACAKNITPYTQTAYVFGTQVDITIYDKDQTKAQSAASKVLANLDRLHTKIHSWHTDSQLYKINNALSRGESIVVDQEIEGLIKQSQKFSKMSDNLFDPAVGNIVALWGFHADSYASKLPDSDKFAKLVEHMPKMNDLHWRGAELSSSNKNLAIDFGGIAKGWALDLSRNILIKNGIKSALINIGGNIIALGAHPDGSKWDIGIQDPRKKMAMAKVQLSDGEAIGTSGDYHRYFIKDGIEHCHLIDPRDGNSNCKKRSVTVLLPASAEAGIRSDALSKPIYFADTKDAGKYLQRFGTSYALIIDNHGNAWISPELSKRLIWLEKIPKINILNMQTNE